MNQLKATTCAWALAAAIAVGFATTSANAAAVVDLSTTDLGTIVEGPETHDLTASVAGDVGDITSTVYLRENDGKSEYLYAYEVTPELDHISEFNTGFRPNTVTVAGWDFAQAADAGGAGDETDIDFFFGTNGSLHWKPTGDWFGNGDSITFFYGSWTSPGLQDTFNMINGSAASGPGLVPAEVTPVPEPASASLLGVLGLAMLRRRRRGRA